MLGGGKDMKKPLVMDGTLMVLVLVLLTSPCFSKDEVDLKPAGEEIDQIDYKGPETHSFIPPPRSKFGPHKYILMCDLRSKGLQSAAGLLGRKAACIDQGNVIIPKP